MAKKLYNDTDVAAIADAIRGKNGSEEKYTLSQMPGAIEALQAAETISPGGIPGYVKEAVRDVIDRVQAVRTDGSIVFLAMSDFHHPNDETAGNQEEINTGNLHAAMAAKILSYALDLDFACMLGDVVWGSSNTTQTQLKSQMAQINGYLEECWGSIPQFRTPGNHDGGAYGGYNVGSAYLFSQIGRFNEGAVYGSTTEGYCYRDFADKSVRIICLNTAEGGEKEVISNTQLLWFAQTLAGTPDGYGIIILSHHPLDWGSVCQASNVVYQFTKHGSVTYNGTGVSFANAGAYVICAVHGHTHCFKTAKLNYISNSTGTEYDVYRIATPNACFTRNNEYGSNGSTEYYGIEFGETISYGKTAGTAKDTAFVINVIDPVNQTINSICYGAGIDRSIYFGAENKYTITNTLTNASSSNSETLVTEGSSYTATITPTEGYEITTLKVTMGGTDITSNAVSGNVITISAVTGNIVITAVAKIDYGVTNLVPTSEALTDTSVFNDTGYQDNTYASDSSTPSLSGYVSTGYIPYTWSPSNVLYIRGATLDTTGHSRIYGYNAKNSMSGNGYATGERLWANPTSNIYFAVEELETGNYYKLVPTQTVNTIKYIRISLLGTGENLIVTVNEPIVASSSSETVAVTGVTLSESAIQLAVGETATLTATVTPSNATNKTVNWSTTIPAAAKVTNGVVTALSVGATTIEAETVDGNYTAKCQVSVTAAQTDTGNYTNRLSSLANLTDGSTVFNSTGYMDDAYVSTVSPFYSSDSSCVTLGAVINGDLSIGSSNSRMAFNSYVYIKGLQFASSHSRVFAIYESSGTFASSNRNTANIATDPTLNTETAVGSTGVKVTKLGDKYYKFYLPKANGSAKIAGFAFSGIAETGANVIVTFNEPIE